MGIKNFLKSKIKIILKPNGLTEFLNNLNEKTLILDVGCGNNSPKRVKDAKPKCYYVGIDIADYNQKINPSNYADEYIICNSDEFTESILKIEKKFDAIISRHNIEHCKNRYETLKAMISKLKIGGKIFLSFPSEDSKYFPPRIGTLNYFDDKTHIAEPPNFNFTLSIIKEFNLTIIYSNNKYQPKLLKIIGFLIEPISKLRNKVMLGTWENYGFEAIIIAKKES